MFINKSTIRTINFRYHKLAQKNNCVILATYVKETNELSLKCKSCNSFFSRSTRALRRKIVCKTCKQVAIKKNEAGKKDGNRGHFFEFLMLSALKDCGHEIKNTKTLRVSNSKIPEYDVHLLNLIKKFVTKRLKNKTDFHIVSHKENANRISSDFLSDEIGISCKKDNDAIKHPHIGAVWNFLSPVNLWELILTEYKDLSMTRDEFFKNTNLSNKDFFNLFMTKKFQIISKLKSTESQTRDIYEFLFGSEKPCIVKLVEKGTSPYLEIQETKNIKTPTSLKFNLFENANGRHQIQILFNNGVSVQMRMKYAQNSSFASSWWNMFKEEWTVLKTPAWENNKTIIKL